MCTKLCDKAAVDRARGHDDAPSPALEKSIAWPAIQNLCEREFARTS